MDDAAAPSELVVQAEQAWSRAADLVRAEQALRAQADGGAPLPAFAAPVVDAWLQQQQRCDCGPKPSRSIFFAAWAHAAQMSASGDLREQYAALLLSTDEVRRAARNASLTSAGEPWPHPARTRRRRLQPHPGAARRAQRASAVTRF
jgi:hypothetical protein